MFVSRASRLSTREERILSVRALKPSHTTRRIKQTTVLNPRIPARLNEQGFRGHKNDLLDSSAHTQQAVEWQMRDRRDVRLKHALLYYRTHATIICNQPCKRLIAKSVGLSSLLSLFRTHEFIILERSRMSARSISSRTTHCKTDLSASRLGL